jgi:SAM-dependent methyltransferase
MLNAEYELELAYWDKELSLLGDYPEDMKNRTIPERMKNIFPSCLFPLMGEVKGRLPKILDVGSGPVSMLNYAVVNNLAEVIAADPLSEGYYKLLFTYGYSIKYPMVTCPGEELSKHFKEGSFDITWCHNALDHSKSPCEVMKEMAHVTRTDGYIVIHTWENEGAYESFYGLHKHNLFFNEGLCLQSLAGDFGMLSLPVNITKDLPVIIHKVEITERQKGRKWIELILKKMPEISL